MPPKRVPKKDIKTSDQKTIFETANANVEVIKKNENDCLDDTSSSHERPPVIVQIPISKDQISEVLKESGQRGVDGSELDEPAPYAPFGHFDANVAFCENVGSSGKKSCCHWCCEEIDGIVVGMPVRYDQSSDTYTTTGNFCSFECALANNFNMNYGSSKMWEINTWVQDMAWRAGYSNKVRPAPSRLSLLAFGGPLSITEFRSMHKGPERTVLCNIPPFVSVNVQTEIVNTSSMMPQFDNAERLHQAQMRLTRKKAVVDPKRSLDTKMNLLVEVQ